MPRKARLTTKNLQEHILRAADVQPNLSGKNFPGNSVKRGRGRPKKVTQAMKDGDDESDTFSFKGQSANVAPKGKGLSTSAGNPPTVLDNESEDDEIEILNSGTDAGSEGSWESECGLCGKDGDLMCCEGKCYKAYHRRCLGLKKVPEGVWKCPVCRPPSMMPKRGRPSKADQIAQQIASRAGVIKSPNIKPKLPVGRPKKATPRLGLTVNPQLEDSDADSVSTWESMCGICEKDGDLLCCEGGCHQSFHIGCVGLAVVPKGEWVCPNCKYAARSKSSDPRSKKSKKAAENAQAKQDIKIQMGLGSGSGPAMSDSEGEGGASSDTSDSQCSAGEDSQALSGDDEQDNANETASHGASRQRVGRKRKLISKMVSPTYFNASATKRTKTWADVGGMDAALVENLQAEQRNSHVLSTSQSDSLDDLFLTCADWLAELDVGNHLMLYGVGSKIKLLEYMVEHLFTDGVVIQVNGHAPQVRPKQILSAFLSALELHAPDQTMSSMRLAIKSALETKRIHQDQPAAAVVEGLGPKRNNTAKLRMQRAMRGEVSGITSPETVISISEGSVDEALDPKMRTGTMKQKPVTRAISKSDMLGKLPRVYLVIHSIDGPAMRTMELKQLVTMLANLPHVRVVATSHHISSAILWGGGERGGGLRWAWHDATTLIPLGIELPKQHSLSAAEGNQISAAVEVLKSLNVNGRSVIHQVILHQLSDESPTSAGISFSSLYSICRKGFLVASENALRAHLAEMKDHKLLRQRRRAEGVVLYVPMGLSQLQQLKEEVQMIGVK